MENQFSKVCSKCRKLQKPYVPIFCAKVEIEAEVGARLIPGPDASTQNPRRVGCGSTSGCRVMPGCS